MHYSPRKAESYWATMRQNMALLYRAETPESSIDAVRSELEDILDSSILIYPPTLVHLGLDAKMGYKDKLEALGLKSINADLTTDQQKMLDAMAVKADKARRQDWSWRITQEHLDKQEKGWYPFFCTLTVDPALADAETVWREGRAVRLWIRDLCKVVTDELGHPEARKKTKQYDYRPESDYITYCGVVEHGQSRMHHHAHFMVWMREIPSSWKLCPNRNCIPAHSRHNRCREMEKYWKYSAHQTRCNYFRSIGDIWKRMEFKTPLDSKSGKPQRIAPPEAVGAYITKYITKDHKQWKHRMKATRGLGMNRLRQTLAKLPDEMLHAMTWRPQTSNLALSLSLIHTVPQGLLRSVAKQMNFCRKYNSRRLDFREVMTSNSGIFSKMLRSVQAGARPDRMPSDQFYDWVSQFLGVHPEYSEYRLKEAHDQLAAVFCPCWRTYDHIQIGANDIGNPQSVP